MCLKEGDKNTGFFYRMTNCHRRKNNMTKIKVNGTWLVEEHEIQGGVVSVFQYLLLEPGVGIQAWMGWCLRESKGRTLS